LSLTQIWVKKTVFGQTLFTVTSNHIDLLVSNDKNRYENGLHIAHKSIMRSIYGQFVLDKLMNIHYLWFTERSLIYFMVYM